MSRSKQHSSCALAHTARGDRLVNSVRGSRKAETSIKHISLQGSPIRYHLLMSAISPGRDTGVDLLLLRCTFLWLLFVPYSGPRSDSKYLRRLRKSSICNDGEHACTLQRSYSVEIIGLLHRYTFGGQRLSTCVTQRR